METQTNQAPITNSEDMNKFQKRIEAYSANIEEYEYADWQEAAKAVIPLEKLIERANAALAGQPKDSATPLSYKDELLKQLLAWFKHEFYTWVNKPECHVCKSPTEKTGEVQGDPTEAPFKVSRVELYKCAVCSEITRFPRYNNVKKLLETRKGRCGEWAQCFTLCARALGYEVRIVYDWTDHVWTEVYSESQQRWLHCDSCENAIDTPLLYEAGWGKKLNYIVAFSLEEVFDVTQRYTKKYTEVQTRRTVVPENWLAEAIAKAHSTKYSKLNPELQERLKQRRRVDEQEFKVNRDFDREEASKIKEDEKIGRISGSEEWRAERGELGDIEKTKAAEQKQEEIKHELNK